MGLPGKIEAPVGSSQPRSAMTPLWVISGFVSLCEIVAGVAATQVDGTVQLIMTWFIVVFPCLIAAAFFLDSLEEAVCLLPANGIRCRYECNRLRARNRRRPS